MCWLREWGPNRHGVILCKGDLPRWPVIFPHRVLITRKKFPWHDVFMKWKYQDGSYASTAKQKSRSTMHSSITDWNIRLIFLLIAWDNCACCFHLNNQYCKDKITWNGRNIVHSDWEGVKCIIKWDLQWVWIYNISSARTFGTAMPIFVPYQTEKIQDDHFRSTIITHSNDTTHFNGTVIWVNFR